MNSAQKQYTNEMKRKFGYFATWNPGLPLELGDIGIMKNNIFNKISNIKNFNITFEIVQDSTTMDLEHFSKGSVEIATKLAGKIPPAGSVLTTLEAGVIVEFNKEKSTLFKANNTTTNSIDDGIKLGNEILKLYKQGKWNKKWVVINELIKAENSTIIISNASNGKIELKANANVDLPNIDIADASFDFTTQFSRGLETKFITTNNLTPLFKIMGIKTKFLSTNPDFEPVAINPLDLITPESAKGIDKDKLVFEALNEKDIL